MSAAPAYPLHAQRGGLAPTPAPAAKMSFYDLQNKFWELHDEATFSPAETHLYFYLLRLFNAARWPAKIYRKRNALAYEVSLDFKTLDKARAKLESRGLLTYVAGNKVQSAIWSLADSSQIQGKISLESENSSQMEGNNSAAFGSNKLDCSQMEGKISPLYKEEEKTTTKEEEKTPTVAADAASGLEKKIEEVTPPVKAQRPASRTRGAGRAEEPADFDGFWQVWPKKEARADAVKAFAKLSADDQAAAASRADTWLAARPDLSDPTRYRFIPHATTWLNQARWTDQAAPLAPPTHAAQHPTSHPPRPVNGHKPLGQGGSLARFLVEQP